MLPTRLFNGSRLVVAVTWLDSRKFSRPFERNQAQQLANGFCQGEGYALREIKPRAAR